MATPKGVRADAAAIITADPTTAKGRGALEHQRRKYRKGLGDPLASNADRVIAQRMVDASEKMLEGGQPTEAPKVAPDPTSRRTEILPEEQRRTLTPSQLALIDECAGRTPSRVSDEETTTLAAMRAGLNGLRDPEAEAQRHLVDSKLAGLYRHHEDAHKKAELRARTHQLKARDRERSEIPDAMHRGRRWRWSGRGS